MFCPKCGSILKLRKDGSKHILACHCGYVDRKKEHLPILSEKVRNRKEIDVLEQDEDTVLPLTKAKCPKCGHGKAHYWLVQTRAGDEPETEFLRCEKCRHIWRSYD